MGRPLGYKYTPEEIARREATRAANRARLGPRANRRDVESEATEYAGDSDYCVVNVGHHSPKLWEE